MRYVTVTYLLLASLVLSVHGADVPSSVSITKLQVTKRTLAALDVHFFNEEGVKLALVFSQPDKVIVGINTAASKLISAADDQGTNLAQKVDPDWTGSNFCKISRTNHEVAMPISLTALPAPGATTIQIKAEIVLTCGSQETTETIKPFDLAKGTSARVGGHAMTVGVGESQNQNQLTLKVTSDESSYWLKKVEFVDEQGNAIKTENAGSERRGGLLTQYVGLNSDVKSAGLRVSYFGKLEDVKQSVDMKIGLGLP